MSVKTLGESPTRSSVLEFLFESSAYGNLGLFIGAGFTKAVFSLDSEEIALSWGQLLEAAGKELGIAFSKLRQDGRSYPEMASAMCAIHATKNACELSASVGLLKQTLSDLTAWYPRKPEKEQYSTYLKEIAPAWIITTNYDLVIENLLPGIAVCLGPNDSFISRKGTIPIFHLHGVRTTPSELVITQEDYVALFRPNEYRQIRLALAMKEATTCLLGYGLGDVNVLTALDWSKKVYKQGHTAYPHDVIQILYKSKPKADPYRLSNGVVVIETPDLSVFFEEYISKATELRKKQAEFSEAIQDVKRLLGAAKADDVSKFISNKKWRKLVLVALPRNNADLVAEFEVFLNAVLAQIKIRSGKTGAFDEYATNLAIILDFLTAFEDIQIHPALLAVIVPRFDSLALYVGNERGSSWAALRLWNERKHELKESLVAELKAIATRHQHGTLKRLLETR